MSEQGISQLPPSLQHFLAQPEKPRVQLAKISYTHDAMIDQIIAHPDMSQQDLAALFGYTGPWVSQVLATDAFQSRMAQRKNEIVDPVIKANIEERMKGLILQSMQKLQEKLAVNPSDELTLGVFSAATKAAGYGARNLGPTINNSFVVNVPGKSASSDAWAEQYSPAGGNRKAEPPSSNAQLPVTLNGESAAVVEESGPAARPAVPPIRADLLTAEVSS